LEKLCITTRQNGGDYQIAAIANVEKEYVKKYNTVSLSYSLKDRIDYQEYSIIFRQGKSALDILMHLVTNI
jgi:hypothetical protein